MYNDDRYDYSDLEKEREYDRRDEWDNWVDEWEVAILSTALDDEEIFDE